MSGASRPATRLLAMLEVLQARGRVSGPELAERLEVDPRTVRRYAVKLEELGIPVEAERGPYGGYRLRPGYKLPPLMLTDDEAAAVVLGLVAARHTGIATQGSGLDEALAKILRVLPTDLRDRVAALQESLTTIWASSRATPPATQVALTLAHATRYQNQAASSDPVRHAGWSRTRPRRRPIRPGVPFGALVPGGARRPHGGGPHVPRRSRVGGGDPSRSGGRARRLRCR
jgi:predicted DNA-binding transcriptional regulator YafY